MDRLFLDANVLFSAAYRERCGLTRLWELNDVVVITSRYAAEEALRNLPDHDQRARLESILRETRLVDEADPRAVNGDDRLPKKDIPILRAAVQARATHLITGDVTHFGQFFGTRLQGVMVVTPGDFLRSRGPRQR